MILEAIADYLENEGVGTVGTDIFIGDFPNETDNGIMLISRGGDNEKNYDLRFLTIDIWGRNKSTRLSWDKIFDVMKALHLQNNFDVTGYHIYRSETANVEDLDRDSEGRKIFKIQARIIYRDTNNIIS